MHKSVALGFVATLLLSGCSGVGSSGPMIDTKGVDQAKYQQDLAECQQYAEQSNVAQDAAIGTVGGAAAGAALGAITGAFFHSAGTGAAIGAATGGGAGLIGGTATGVDRKTKIVNNCLRGRGYSVLD